MRLLHTSDWHLGQTLHNFDRSYEHQRFLDWLLDTLAAESIDVLIVAGDVFDNANPSAASQRQLYRFLTAARARVPHLNIVLIAGNHDSPGRLEAPAPFLHLFDAAVVGQVQRGSDGTIDLERLLVPLRNRQGEVEAWCLAIPFLRPGELPRVEEEGDPYTAGVKLLYRQALDLAVARRQPGQAIVALGHCHLVGGQVSDDSERRILIGGAEALPAAMFGAAVAYAALGHLHFAQPVGGHAHLRYSGSPLPLSFSEIAYPHQVVRVDLEGETVREIASIPVPRAVDLLRVPARPAPLEEALAALASLDPAAGAEESWPYLEVRVRLDAPEPGLRARVEAALAGKPVRLAKIETTYGQAVGETGAAPLSLDDIGRLEPTDIFQRLYRQKQGGEAPEPLLAAFAELLHQADGEIQA